MHAKLIDQIACAACRCTCCIFDAAVMYLYLLHLIELPAASASVSVHLVLKVHVQLQMHYSCMYITAAYITATLQLHYSCSKLHLLYFYPNLPNLSPLPTTPNIYIITLIMKPQFPRKNSPRNNLLTNPTTNNLKSIGQICL